jgi:hypothetical protein
MRVSHGMAIAASVKKRRRIEEYFGWVTDTVHLRIRNFRLSFKVAWIFIFEAEPKIRCGSKR